MNLFEFKYYKNYDEDFTNPYQIIDTPEGTFEKKLFNCNIFVYKKIPEGTTEYFDVCKEEPVTLKEGPVFIKKIPGYILNNILKFFNFFAEKNLEAKVDIFWDTVNKNYILFIPLQIVSMEYVLEFTPLSPVIDEEMLNCFKDVAIMREKMIKREVILISEIHSHHHMRCSFSGIDNRNDNCPGRIYGVIRNIPRDMQMDLRYFIDNKTYSFAKENMFDLSLENSDNFNVLKETRKVNPSMLIKKRGMLNGIQN